MIRDLQMLAGVHRLMIVVPTAEALTFFDADGTECPTVFNSTLIINQRGEISHMRRSIPFVKSCADSSYLTQAYHDKQNESYALFDMETKNGVRFKSVVAICAESGGTYLADLMATQFGQIDFLLFPEGMDAVQPGIDIMRRIQNFGDFDPEQSFVHGNVSNFALYADYLVHAGLAIKGRVGQGIYAFDHSELAYIFTQQFYEGGYLYARAAVKNQW